MKLTDLTLNRYTYYPAKTVTDDPDNLWTDFRTALIKVVEEMGEENAKASVPTQRPDLQKGYFVPIITLTNALKGPTKPITTEPDKTITYKFHRTLKAGTLYDVYALQRWVGKEEKEIIDSDSLSAIASILEKEFDDTPITGNHLSSDALCYFTECEEPQTDTFSIFSKLFGSQLFSPVELDYAYFAAGLSGRTAKAVIISKNFVEEGKEKATKLFEVLLGEYFLSFAKVNFEIKNIEDTTAKETRTTLNKYLKDINKKQPSSLSEIEIANHDLSQLRFDLAEESKGIEGHLHTIKINIENAEKILNNPLLDQQKAVLNPIIIQPLKSPLEQINADLVYFNIDKEKANVIGEEITNLSSLQSSIWGRKLSWLFGLLSLLGALQLFPEFQNWKVENCTALWWKIGILTFIISGVILIIFWGDITDRLFGRSKENSLVKKVKKNSDRGS